MVELVIIKWVLIEFVLPLTIKGLELVPLWGKHKERRDRVTTKIRGKREEMKAKRKKPNG